MSSEMRFAEKWLEIITTYGYNLLISILLACLLLITFRRRSPKMKLPAGPVGLPVVGYLPFLGKEPFRTLHNLSKQYGNVFSLYLGRKLVIVLGDYEAVKEAFNKSETLDRPPGMFDFQPDEYGISSSSGQEWVQNRRLFMKIMKDVGFGGSKWGHLLENEVHDFLMIIANTKGDAVDIEKTLTSSLSNNIMSLAFGRRLPPGPSRDMLNNSLEAMATFFSQAGLWNFLPWLCNIFLKLKIAGYHKIFSEMTDLNIFVRKEIEMRKKSADHSKDSDFVARFMESMEKNRDKKEYIYINERNLIGNSQALFFAGSETTRTSLLWLFRAMSAYPNVQRKVHLELDCLLGKSQKASWSDHLKFPYTYAVILEGQRWKTVVPLNLVRMASQDFKLYSHDVPRGATIIANLWGLHNHPRYWEEPEIFNPERFLQDESKNVNLKAESFAPFSYGKRRCPGETVAMMEIFLYFTAIMQQYEIRAPNGEKPNMDGILGITYMPVPQEVCFIPR